MGGAKVAMPSVSTLPDLIPGHRFNYLTVIRETKGSRPGRHVEVQCDCGNRKIIAAPKLLAGDTQSCGCMRGLLIAKKRITHGATKTAEYQVWQGMLRRCANPRMPGFPNYGGRGITVCERWRDSFENFYADMGRRPSADHSIDRIDNDGPYSPENCRWATRSEQARNKSTNRVLTYRGITATVAEWSERTGIHHRTITSRLRDHGWAVCCALNHWQAASCESGRQRPELQQREEAE